MSFFVSLSCLPLVLSSIFKWEWWKSLRIMERSIFVEILVIRSSNELFMNLLEFWEKNSTEFTVISLRMNFTAILRFWLFIKIKKNCRKESKKMPKITPINTHWRILIIKRKFSCNFNWIQIRRIAQTKHKKKQKRWTIIALPRSLPMIFTLLLEISIFGWIIHEEQQQQQPIDRPTDRPSTHLKKKG